MKIRTTLNLDADDAALIAGAAETLGVTRSAIVSALANYAGSRAPEQCALWKPVRYQTRRPGERWKKMHVTMRGDEYEYCIDLRKLVKCSFSGIIAHAVNHYLDAVMRLIKDDPDNYRYRNYAAMGFILDGVKSWVFYWGIPPVLLLPEGYEGDASPLTPADTDFKEN